MRWAEFLSRFNFRIVYRPGTVNSRADALSRRPQDAPTDIEDDRLLARRIPQIPDSKFDTSYRLCTLDVSRSIDDLIDEAYKKSALMIATLEDLTDQKKRRWSPMVAKVLRIAFAECKVVANRVYFRERLLIPPDDEQLQLQILHRTHNSFPAGHPGRVRTIDLLNRSYWWPGMNKAARIYCKGCITGIKTKTPRSAPPGFLKPLPSPATPWREITVDYIILKVMVDG
ncbi:hypothetical protein K3495_g15131 [Podosphaera aphanis]|nr:hypothetical protein K3495_g15131 [Podosphaera aphanis]